MPPPPELIFSDDGYSGSTLVRPALERLRDIAAVGAVDRLYVHSPDRLARDFAHQILLIDELHRAGVEIVFLNHDVDDSPEGNLLLQIQGVIAQYERAKLLERSRRGRRHAARSGAIAALTGAPYGYQYITKSDGDGRADYRVALDEARVVRQIFEWVGREHCALREVVRRLKTRGIPTRTGNAIWEPATVVGLLKNPAYKGMAALGKTCRIERRPRLRPRRGQSEFPRRNSCTRDTSIEEQDPIPVPALVDEETFAAAQEQLARNREHHGRPAIAGRYLVQGLVVCSECGRAYSGADHTKSSGPKPTGEPRQAYGYYRCSGNDGRRFDGVRVCSNRSVRTDRLDAAVWQDVCGLLLEPQRIEAEYRRRLNHPTKPSDRNREAIDKQIQGLKRRMARLTEMYEEAFLDRDAFHTRMASARTRLDTLEAEARVAADQESSETELRLVIGHLETFARRLLSGLDECDWQARQEIIRAVVKRIEIGADHVRVVYKVSPAPFERGPQERGVLGNCKRLEAPALQNEREPSGDTIDFSRSTILNYRADGLNAPCVGSEFSGSRLSVPVSPGPFHVPIGSWRWNPHPAFGDPLQRERGLG